jgi:DNA-binding IclR family transcriptional regulator
MANRQADKLARELGACVVVSTVMSGETRAVAVFDRGPVTMVRARVGQIVPLAPPFGVVFVAWDGAASQRWLNRAGSAEAESADAARWHQSLQFARRHGYSFSVYAPPGREFGQVLEDLVVAPNSELDLRTRDELIGQLRHSEYLATQVDDEGEVQLIQVAAPVFDADGAVAASIMVLGSTRPMRGAAVEALGRRVVQAADEAATMARELLLGDPAAAI